MKGSNLAILSDAENTQKIIQPANEEINPLNFSSKTRLQKDGKSYYLRGANWRLLNSKKTKDHVLYFHDGWQVDLNDLTCEYKGVYSPIYTLKFEEVSPASDYNF